MSFRNIDRMSRAAAASRGMLSGVLILAGANAFLSVSPALAHHSSAPFDGSKSVVLEGTVRAMEWANPHVWIRLEVIDDGGSVVEWGIETSNPLSLGRHGWTRNTFRPGDKVTITVNPAKDGSTNGAFVKAVLADGSVLTTGALIDESERNPGSSE